MRKCKSELALRPVPMFFSHVTKCYPVLLKLKKLPSLSSRDSQPSRGLYKSRPRRGGTTGRIGIVRQISGVEWTPLAQRHVVRPLGITRSGSASATAHTNPTRQRAGLGRVVLAAHAAIVRRQAQRLFSRTMVIKGRREAPFYARPWADGAGVVRVWVALAVASGGMGCGPHTKA